ncbi:hypothetical protein [Adhaeribacter aerolatus]|uniref:hypothetical protein n=1 Tax=Adhaeribacter aerolatus TaxID=670289 RepID=UPI001478F70F|nr:hypothetical protein [Adhaeribacter aerolatus]
MSSIRQLLLATDSSLGDEGLSAFRCFSIARYEQRKDEQPEWPNGARRPGGFLGDC